MLNFFLENYFMKKTILFTFLFSAIAAIQAQEALPSSGGESTGTGGSASYTVGQVFYTTNSSSSGSLALGVQQAFEFQTLSNPLLSSLQLSAVTYPNPTTDFVVLKITDSALKNLEYTLFDLNGKSIASDAILNSSTEIQMKHLSIGAYLLKVSQQNQSIKTFKIIKHQ